MCVIDKSGALKEDYMWPKGESGTCRTETDVLLSIYSQFHDLKLNAKLYIGYNELYSTTFMLMHASIYSLIHEC